MVTVVMTTYNPVPEAPRFDYAVECLEYLRAHLSGPQPIAYIVADDGSPVQPHQGSDLRHRAQYVTGPHNGIGASLNRAMALLAFDEPWIYTTDDWRLQELLDLALPLHLLDIGYDIVRLGPIHPNITCRTQFEHPYGWWLDLDVHSNQYVCGTRPFLASPRLIEKVGPFEEGVDSYRAEIDFCARCELYDVRVAAINLDGPWEHIGEYAVGNLPVLQSQYA